MTVPDRSVRVSADRGGTFTDIIGTYPKNGKQEEIVVKLCEFEALSGCTN